MRFDTNLGGGDQGRSEGGKWHESNLHCGGDDRRCCPFEQHVDDL